MDTSRAILSTVKASSIVCCGVLELLPISWMNLTENGNICFPYMEDVSGTMYRVNNCPSCGKYVRDIIIEVDK
tara:strand:- start:54 stop:272 length:219 start_codon:yes stop_codon:yes gene_type:complete